MYEKPKILLCGDKAVIVEFGNEISEECNKKVVNLYRTLEKEKSAGIISMIPTYRSLLIKYDPLKIAYDELLKLIESSNKDKNESTEEFRSKIYEIPVAYGGEFGPDLDFVAKYHNMTAEEIISIHTQPFYRIYMVGFTMGFAYLGGMSEKIATPRLENPRTEIKAGSVGIAGNQTGIYPLSSPGGWRIIGRTPVRLYDPERERPILFEAGNYIKFVPITGEEFYKIEKEIEMKRYQIKIYDYE
ncbi:5-oxoprolinase subunit PxpB [Thermoanaerobacter brockii subsp. lactiethylicus]|jgi:KipI family sensor histidine kinase inhibitor|uniref:Allophanate hydrolase subunit 1 n=2 Tax=Thermoanaerobacter TaxID=1754 RepID=B0K9K0_THEP3|nr:MULTISPECIES: 5-oxoprolinase subunit PxpB [Thermoanaerobacter]ABY92882.1 Allophanate hydrolase subunit 1 [Thermoanaerobacter sp. X514]ABY94813.1 Allophanate hydrolase subunit 1 [Thermoanaerobacter pseudethanolicus ATCC 33223]ADV79762.1 Allophanate hydrolase subunit 1 [Thermoanaerobacter brockii subsp. finnii Ako-1]MDI3530075.1 inhibitor of KinA [Thermoanaerobacter sp.]HBW58790.1 allophanate hydrolase subunit 1 [Thermoanaerobacter sp.]